MPRLDFGHTNSALYYRTIILEHLFDTFAIGVSQVLAVVDFVPELPHTAAV